MRKFWGAAVLAGVGLLTAPVLRTLLLVEKDLPWAYQDLRGLLSDLALGALLAVLALWVAGRTRVGAWLLAAAWVVVNFINYEHIRVFDAPVKPTYAAYLTDATFLQGSALQLTHPALFAGAMILLCGSAGFWGRGKVPGRALGLGAGGAAAVLSVSTLVPLHAHHLPWRQLHVLPLTLRDALAHEEKRPEFSSPEAALRVAQVYRVDLEGEPRFPLGPPAGRGPPNVLIVAMEGLSGGYLPSVARHQGVALDIAMPLLDEAGNKGLVFESFLAHQRQTNRGMYAILCGDLPKLQSREARMSEFPRHEAEARRRCLPQILADAGYRTAYLQAAPLAFMMKDQFMSAIGFEQVRGTGAFPDAYVRNRWGVDDRAFFEQSARKLQALGADGKPWFATLLTVGTHHPFLVPDGFGKGSSLARAVAYGDQAVEGLLQTLEETGLLENTLVLVTSDESAGITRGDDLTRSLSQSWAPLVVLGPGVAPGRVSEVFTHADLAISVLDYLGLPDRGAHLMGRSVFRQYGAPRPLYFANTYFSRVYALDEDGVLSLCTEGFDECRSHSVDPRRPFGAARRPVAWQPQRLEGWRGVVARSVEPLRATGPQTITLVHRDRVEVTGAEALIVFGGQYLTAEAGSRYEVEVDFEVERADGLVDPMQDLSASGGALHRPGLALLAEGDRVRLRYDLVFKSETSSVEARFTARPVMGTHATLRIHKAQLTVTPGVGDGTWQRVSEHQLEVQRRPSQAGLSFSLEDPAPFRTPRCVREDRARRVLVGTGCRATYPVFGPYAWARPGAKVKARFDVELTRGEGNLRADLVSDLSRKRHAMGDRHTLKAGDRRVLEVEFLADAPVEAIEARLELRPVGDPVDLVVHAASLVVEPPPPASAATHR
jgi:phosphoglycerol transferase MdoB-like AlkP superfamily enzyme